MVYFKNLNKGTPSTSTIPKSKDDLILKFNYVNNYEELLDILEKSEIYFTGEVMAKFIENFSR
jgi:hypothetical protein